MGVLQSECRGLEKGRLALYAVKRLAAKGASFLYRGGQLLLLLPFIGLMIVPFYNVREPVMFGFPFFYWYQLAWVPLTSLLTWIVYRSVRDAE
jgi:hypothetical protein